MKNKFVHWFVILIMTLLYFGVSIISTIHVVDFFLMTNTFALALSLAIGFEMGAAASLASITVLEKTNKPLVWTLFIVLTLFQAMGNMYSTYVSAHDYVGFVELFGLTDFSEIAQKRILALLSGAILPLVALGYIKSLVDYIKPDDKKKEEKKKKPDLFDDMFDTKPKKEEEHIEKEEDNVVKVEPILKKAPEASLQQPKAAEKEKPVDDTVKTGKKKKSYITTTKKNPK